MHANVNNLMQGELGEWLASQVDMRAAAKEQAANRWTWVTVLLLPPLAFLWFGPEALAGLRMIASIGGIIGVGVWGYQPIAEARSRIQVGITSAIARSLGIAHDHEVEPEPNSRRPSVANWCRLSSAQLRGSLARHARRAWLQSVRSPS